MFSQIRYWNFGTKGCQPTLLKKKKSRTVAHVIKRLNCNQGKAGSNPPKWSLWSVVHPTSPFQIFENQNP